jgi:hypothetical protein
MFKCRLFAMFRTMLPLGFTRMRFLMELRVLKVPECTPRTTACEVAVAACAAKQTDAVGARTDTVRKI